MANEHGKILVGKIVAPQGIRGDVRVQTFSEKPSDFQKFKVQSAKFKTDDFKFVRTVPNSSVIIAHISGIDDRTTAETLRGTELFIDRDTLPTLNGNEYYQADLIGFTVVRNGDTIGTVAGFQNFGAGDIIELGNGEYVSFIGADVDMEQKTIAVK
ncbi:MAG: 16S rRNA processing protein RimM [Alphaproteobacteria bacterium]|nr:16S rRNA processing protein RimM [Alphaproteobacteria bacterium]